MVISNRYAWMNEATGQFFVALAFVAVGIGAFMTYAGYK